MGERGSNNGVFPLDYFRIRSVLPYLALATLKYKREKVANSVKNKDKRNFVVAQLTKSINCITYQQI